jgi:hypothetical protein
MASQLSDEESDDEGPVRLTPAPYVLLGAKRTARWVITRQMRRCQRPIGRGSAVHSRSDQHVGSGARSGREKTRPRLKSAFNSSNNFALFPLLPPFVPVDFPAALAT